MYHCHHFSKCVSETHALGVSQDRVAACHNATVTRRAMTSVRANNATLPNLRIRKLGMLDPRFWEAFRARFERGFEEPLGRPLPKRIGESATTIPVVTEQVLLLLRKLLFGFSNNCFAVVLAACGAFPFGFLGFRFWVPASAFQGFGFGLRATPACAGPNHTAASCKLRAQKRARSSAKGNF